MSRRPTLVTLDAEPPAVGAVAMLQEMLRRVKQGEISSLAIAAVLRDGSGEQDWTYAPSAAALIGSVAVLQHQLIKEELE